MELSLGEPVVLPPSLSVGEVSVAGDLTRGSEVRLSVVVQNDGEGDAYYVNVSFVIDGKVAGTVLLDRVAAGGSQTASFQWMAQSGAHTVAVTAQAQDSGPAASPLKSIEVASPAAPAESTDLTIPIVVAVVVVAAAAGAAGVLIMRRRKG
jgi:subtilase family serine protease